ncbi:MAG: lipase family protein [Actinomycetota bacterium]|nr:lipase family protein [Actinomycetota bacterium]
MLVQLNRFQTLLALAVFALASIFLASTVLSSSAEAKVRKGPAGVKFYKPPKKTPKQHGRMIWVRKSTGAVPLASAAWTRNVLYTSKTPLGKRAVVSGSISVPKGKAPRGGWPIITYGHGTTGIADQCAPSRNKKNGPADNAVNYTDNEQNAWLKAGYAVARSDYQGLGTPGIHPFLIGKASGRSVLDIVRAAHDLNTKFSKRYLIAGHSQGGHAALFAAGEAAKWIPELKLRGTLAYAPASHMKEQAGFLPNLTTPSSLTALAAMIVKGATVVTKDIKPAELLSDSVLGLYPQTGTRCLEQLAKPNSLGGIAPSALIREGADTGPLFDLLAEQNPAVKTAAPVMVAQGDADVTTFKILTDPLISELTALGTKVDYRVYEGAAHFDILDVAKADAIEFFQKRLPSGR